MLLRRFVAAALVCGLMSACGGEADPVAEGPAPEPSSPAAPADPADADAPAQAAATQTATQFLTALVTEDFDAAYALLSPAAQAGTALGDFAGARQQKAASARSLSQRYELTAATGGPGCVTVTGDGRLADGTPAAISLPLVMNESGWRVDAVPTSF